MKVFEFVLHVNTDLDEATFEEQMRTPVKLAKPGGTYAGFEVKAAGKTAFEAKCIEHGPHRELFTIDARHGDDTNTALTGGEMVLLSEVLNWLAEEHGTAALPRFRKELERE